MGWTCRLSANRKDGRVPTKSEAMILACSHAHAGRRADSSYRSDQPPVPRSWNPDAEFQSLLRAFVNLLTLHPSGAVTPALDASSAQRISRLSPNGNHSARAPPDFETWGLLRHSLDWPPTVFWRFLEVLLREPTLPIDANAVERGGCRLGHDRRPLIIEVRADNSVSVRFQADSASAASAGMLRNMATAPAGAGRAC
jgi:hypothetical protein